jgi:zinc protease
MKTSSDRLQTLPGPDDTLRVELSNGIVVLARPNFNSPSVVIGGYWQAGSLFDPAEKLGLADFTAAALMRGSTNQSFQTIYDRLESAGASLGFGGGTHSSSFMGRALVEDLDLLLEILSDVLRQPAFPEDEFRRQRTQRLTGLAIRAQETGDMASLAFNQLVFANHPYANPEEGFIKTVERIEVEDLRQFHRRHYGPREMRVVIVGGIEPEVAIEKVRAHLGDWRNPAQPMLPEVPAHQPLSKTRRRKVTIPDKMQSDIILGGGGPRLDSPDYLAAALGNSVLGQFGMYGRTGERVREQAGLAYYAYSTISPGIAAGAWYAGAGVAPANVSKTIKLVRQEIERFVSEPVSEQELDDSKSAALGSLPLNFESNAAVAGSLMQIERAGLGLDYYRNYPELLRAVTRAEALAAAQNYLHPDRLAIAVAGS